MQPRKDVPRIRYGQRVSILTRSGDRVQPIDTPIVSRQSHVSILTRSGDRVQLTLCVPCGERHRFQSSPGLETGCNSRFASHAVNGTGFNPHPVWRPGATPTCNVPLDVGVFQSSPGLETGCNRGTPTHWRLRRKVSILTRSGDRVQRPSRTGQPGRSWCFNPHPVWRPGATVAHNAGVPN